MSVADLAGKNLGFKKCLGFRCFKVLKKAFEVFLFGLVSNEHRAQNYDRGKTCYTGYTIFLSKRYITT